MPQDGQRINMPIIGLEKEIQPQWFSTKEAAYFLRLTPNALRIRVFRGQIKAYKIGSQLRFKKEDLSHAIRYKEGNSND